MSKQESNVKQRSNSSYAGNSANGQEAELREQILKEFKQVLKLAPADYTENCTNVVISMVNAYTTKLLNEQLDRLAAQRGILSDPVHGEKSIPLSAIKNERNKLKESSNV